MTGRRSRAGRPRWRRWLAWLLVMAFLASLMPILLLRYIDPPTTAFMLARQWQMRAVPEHVLRYHWVDLDAMSAQLPIALVAAEDQKFPRHRGFDLDAISDVLATPGDAGPARGASTISQQVAKNLFLWQGRSWLRKGIEGYATVLIELFWPKRRILEVYANIAEFGDGIYGAEAAARHFFQIPAAQLDASQAAALAAVLPSPRRFRVDAPTPYQLRRRAWIERQVIQLGGPAWLEECCGPTTTTR